MVFGSNEKLVFSDRSMSYCPIHGSPRCSRGTLLSSRANALLVIVDALLVVTASSFRDFLCQSGNVDCLMESTFVCLVSRSTLSVRIALGHGYGREHALSVMEMDKVDWMLLTCAFVTSTGP
ncbi:hypothetical protein D5086_015900 [Populus alba]|uniref:Uncharacterized protein n=1 Tax=Populus alba TaxID=43335 RepID=A0ACC4BUJ3_POPAL